MIILFFIFSSSSGGALYLRMSLTHSLTPGLGKSVFSVKVRRWILSFQLPSKSSDGHPNSWCYYKVQWILGFLTNFPPIFRFFGHKYFPSICFQKLKKLWKISWKFQKSNIFIVPYNNISIMNRIIREMIFYVRLWDWSRDWSSKFKQ